MLIDDRRKTYMYNSFKNSCVTHRLEIIIVDLEYYAFHTNYIIYYYSRQFVISSCFQCLFYGISVVFVFFNSFYVFQWAVVSLIIFFLNEIGPNKNCHIAQENILMNRNSEAF